MTKGTGPAAITECSLLRHSSLPYTAFQPQETAYVRFLVSYKHNPQQNGLVTTPNEELSGSYKYKHTRSTGGGNVPYYVGQFVGI